jgi:hypothetical protein
VSPETVASSGGDGGSGACIPSGEYRAAIIGSAPIRYFRFDEDLSTIELKEEMSGTMMGTYQTSPTERRAPGLIADGGCAISLEGASTNGAGGYLKLGTMAELDFSGVVPFSFEFWFRPRAGSNNFYNRILSREKQNGALRDGYMVGYFRNSALETPYLAFERLSSGGNQQVDIMIDLDGKRTHFVGTFDGTVLRSYLNGKLTGSDTPAPVITSEVFELTVGAYSTGGGEHFAGEVDELAIYDRALSAAEIYAHCFIGAVEPGMCSS